MHVKFSQNYDHRLNEGTVIAYPAGLEDTIPKEHAEAAIQLGVAKEVPAEARRKAKAGGEADGNGEGATPST